MANHALHLAALRAVVPQLSLLLIISALNIGAHTGVLPPTNQLIEKLMQLISDVGWPIVALASFLETVVGVGTYFPGSVILLAAMAVTSGQPVLALQVYTAVVIAAVAGNLVSYAVGASTSKARNADVSSRNLTWWYLGTYWHPQLGALTSMASGAAGVPLPRFLRTFLPISLAWSVLWGFVLYRVGRKVTAQVNWDALVFTYAILWLLWGLRQFYRARTR